MQNLLSCSGNLPGFEGFVVLFGYSCLNLSVIFFLNILMNQYQHANTFSVKF